MYKSLIDKSYYRKDSEKVHLWLHLLYKASHPKKEDIFAGKSIIVNPGQFTTGRRQLSEETGISESKIERILTYFEKIEQQIEQRKSTTNRLISIKNWQTYQGSEQQSEQQMNNDRTTNEQRKNAINCSEPIKNKQTYQKVNNDRTTNEQQIEQQSEQRKNAINCSEPIKNKQTYQENEQQSEQRFKRKVNTLLEYKNINIRTPLTPLKGGKDFLKELDEIFSELKVKDPLKEIFIEWLDYKKSRRESYKSKKSIILAFKKLYKYSRGDPEKAKEIIERSMANNWAGFFELNEDKINKSPFLRLPKEKIQYGIRWYLDEKTGNYYDSKGNLLM